MSCCFPWMVPKWNSRPLPTPISPEVPCTHNLGPGDHERVVELLRGLTPDNFTLTAVSHRVGIGRRPHMWLAEYETADVRLQTGYIRSIKTTFEGRNPRGTVVDAVYIANVGVPQPYLRVPCVVVEYVVKCSCGNT